MTLTIDYDPNVVDLYDLRTKMQAYLGEGVRGLSWNQQSADDFEVTSDEVVE